MKGRFDTAWDSFDEADIFFHGCRAVNMEPMFNWYMEKDEKVFVVDVEGTVEELMTASKRAQEIAVKRGFDPANYIWTKAEIKGFLQD